MRQFALAPFVAGVFVSSALFLVGCIGAVADGDDEEVASVEQASPSGCPANVPPALNPPAGQTIAFTYKGVGVQIYDCKATANGYAWTFRAPLADLLKSNGKNTGTHYAGPTWESKDGSTVVGARVAGATVDPTAIPWLLLTAVSHTGDGKMSDVVTIQRLSTTGGLAPATGCDAAHVGDEADVPYTADYIFYEPVDEDEGGDDDDVQQCAG